MHFLKDGVQTRECRSLLKLFTFKSISKLKCIVLYNVGKSIELNSTNDSVSISSKVKGQLVSYLKVWKAMTLPTCFMSLYIYSAGEQSCCKERQHVTTSLLGITWYCLHTNR